MKVNIAVSGRFHFHNYVRYLDARRVLNRFYYAHRLSTNADALGIRHGKTVNVWFKEYLLQTHSRVLPTFGAETCKPYYRHIWEIVSLARWRPCDLLHIMLHGGGRRLIRKAMSEGSVVIGEPVNAHPDMQNDILNSEAERLKIKMLQRRTRAQDLILDEISSVDRLVVASSFLKRSYVEKGYPANRIDILPYGVDLSRFSTQARERANNHGFRVICVAGINMRKGIVDLLDAWKILNIPDSELLLVGRISNEMVPVLRRYDGLFRHIPFVPNNELKQQLRSSSVFVLPSLEDGFGLVCTEAMASGLPVITTQNTGAAELIEEGVSGYVVPIRSPERIAEKLETLYQNPELSKTMGDVAAETARKLCGWEGYADQLLNHYHDWLNQPRNSRL